MGIWFAVSASIWLSVKVFRRSAVHDETSHFFPVPDIATSFITDTPPVIAVAAMSNSATLSSPTDANDAPVRVPPTTISKYASFDTARMRKSERSICARFVLELKVDFGRMESTGRLVVTDIGVIQFPADCGKPLCSSPHSDCIEQQTNWTVPPATARTVSRNIPFAWSK